MKSFSWILSTSINYIKMRLARGFLNQVMGLNQYIYTEPGDIPVVGRDAKKAVAFVKRAEKLMQMAVKKDPTMSFVVEPDVKLGIKLNIDREVYQKKLNLLTDDDLAMDGKKRIQLILDRFKHLTNDDDDEEDWYDDEDYYDDIEDDLLDEDDYYDQLADQYSQEYDEQLAVLEEAQNLTRELKAYYEEFLSNFRSFNFNWKHGDLIEQALVQIKEHLTVRPDQVETFTYPRYDLFFPMQSSASDWEFNDEPFSPDMLPGLVITASQEYYQ